MKAIKWLIGLGLLASLAHFADNTFAIERYPEPSWITPLGVAVTWFIISGIALVALARARADARFWLFATLYALILTSGFLHYLYSSPMHMAMRSNATVIVEGSIGIALIAALTVLARSRSRTGAR